MGKITDVPPMDYERPTPVVPLFEGVYRISMVPGQDGREWKLCTPLAYRSRGGVRYRVDSGFTTDGASIPRLFWRLIGPPFAARYAPAALIHDALYATGYGDRQAADRLFREMMAVLDVKPWRRLLMYAAVRAGGWLPWSRRTDESVKHALRFLEVTHV